MKKICNCNGDILDYGHTINCPKRKNKTICRICGLPKRKETKFEWICKCKMKIHNNFKDEDRLMLQDAWMCWWCGENTADCLHHIVGRGNNGSVVESSVLNAAPLCNQKCHLKQHGLIRTEEYTSLLLKQTHKYVINHGYKLTRNDHAFMLKYAKYYK